MTQFSVVQPAGMKTGSKAAAVGFRGNILHLGEENPKQTKPKERKRRRLTGGSA